MRHLCSTCGNGSTSKLCSRLALRCWQRLGEPRQTKSCCKSCEFAEIFASRIKYDHGYIDLCVVKLDYSESPCTPLVLLLCLGFCLEENGNSPFNPEIKKNEFLAYTTRRMPLMLFAPESRAGSFRFLHVSCK